MKQRIFFWTFLVVVSVAAMLVRLFPHFPNFTPIGALFLFVGVYASGHSKWVIAFPLFAMFFADLVIGLDDIRIMAAVYGSFLLYTLFGALVAKLGIFRKGIATLFGSVAFFLVTNWAVWAFSSLYSHTVSGLILSYFMGLPFLQYTVAGDLFFSAILFGSYALLERRVFRREFQLQSV